MKKESQTSNFLKYQGKSLIKNNPLKKFLISLFFRKIYQEIKKTNPKKMIDLGCGEGFLEKYLKSKNLNIEITAVDINQEALKYAKKNNPGVKFLAGDILNFKSQESFDLAVMLEVLEHLPTHQKALKTAKGLSKKILVSVPWEPYFSWLYLLAGLNLKRRGKHPEHRQFFHPQTLKTLLKKYFRKVETKSNWPWLIAISQN
ncbi:methyltransferase domain-containing protein [Candidatus Shapirobacteria bacterium]|nr:methyltransferase domain-containing protein [Candidatus Shapirobacteria bacterium]